MSEKLQKILARAGHGSRREIEEWIRAGRVSVNGKVAKLGDRAELTDKFRVNGRTLHKQQLQSSKERLIIYNKPEGEICTRRDPERRKSVFDSLPRLVNKRWVSVGRLDINSSGLLLFTTDGELANRLMHPSNGIEREYAVRVLGNLTDDMGKRLKKGVKLEDGYASFKSIRDAGGTGVNHWYHVVLTEGRQREVRRLFESQRLKVSRLIRVRFGSIKLPPYLRTGRWEEVEPAVNSTMLAVNR